MGGKVWGGGVSQKITQDDKGIGPGCGKGLKELRNL